MKLEMGSEGEIVEVLLSREFSDFDRRTGDNKTRPTTGAGSSHRKSVQPPLRFVILHSVYDSLGRLVTASERTASKIKSGRNNAVTIVLTKMGYRIPLLL